MTLKKVSLTNILGLFLTIVGCHSVLADTFNYEIQNPQQQHHAPVYPNLDLHNIEKVSLTTTFDYQTGLTLDRLEIFFPNATNLVATNFSNHGEIYKTVVEDAWVYSGLLVEVQPIHPGPDAFQTDNPLSVQLSVVEQKSNLNHPAHSSGLQILGVDGLLTNTTANKIVDIAQLVVDEKQLTLELNQRPEFNMYDQGFKINALWMGHGEQTIYIPAPFSHHEFHAFKAVAIDTISETYPDGYVDVQLQISYQDEFGQTQTTPMQPLLPILEAVFPPTN